MDRRTQTMVALTVVALGIGVVALGFIEEESGVRYVEDLVDRPDEHASGTYTLIGTIQPAVFEEANGTSTNPQYDDVLTHGSQEVRDGRTYLITHSLAAHQSSERTITWTLTTAERATDRSGPATVVSEQTWTSTGLLFQVDAFEEDRTVWAVYNGVTEPLARKPSQMTGQLASTPDVPSGALVFNVETLAQQCSSKFVPEDLRDEYDKDGDGLTD